MILVTGASGFVGLNLIPKLIDKYAKENILIISREHLQQIVLRKQFSCSSEGFDAIEKYKNNIELVVHMGSNTPKDSSNLNSIGYYDDNIFFTKLLIENEFINLKKFIYISTIDVYDEGVNFIREDSKVSPNNEYSKSKFECENLVTMAMQNRGINSQILRLGHIYGPGEKAYKKVIPIAIQKALRGEKIEIIGSGEELRSFIHVDDVVKSIMSSIETVDLIQTINIAGSNPISITHLMQLIITLTNAPIGLVKQRGANVGRSVVVDSTLREHHLLKTEKDFKSGLLEEIDYFRNSPQ